MKYAIMSAVRSMGLLPAVDRLRFHHRRLQSAQSNRRFLSKNPDFAMPPENLAFDAYNNIDWEKYDSLGRLQSQAIVDAILAHAPPGRLDVLEWGCGPGRLIRHLPAMLGTRAATICGTDYNPSTIEWCRANLKGIGFALNPLMPPLPFADESFDVIYNFSVFTHLSREAHVAWAEELRRVLRPGGILLSTTHGDSYKYLLAKPEEKRAYDAGEIVTQASFEEGKKFYFAVHPPTFVKNDLFRDFTEVRELDVPASAQILQSLWLARRPVADQPIVRATSA